MIENTKRYDKIDEAEIKKLKLQHKIKKYIHNIHNNLQCCDID